VRPLLRFTLPASLGCQGLRITCSSGRYSYLATATLPKDKLLNEQLSGNVNRACLLHTADDMNHSIANHLRGEATLHFDPFPAVLRTLDIFFAELQKEEGWVGKDIAVFIDTNPAFTEYTQLALCELALTSCGVAAGAAAAAKACQAVPVAAAAALGAATAAAAGETAACCQSQPPDLRSRHSNSRSQCSCPPCRRHQEADHPSQRRRLFAAGGAAHVQQNLEFV
jgi:hypothetical protein